MKTKEKSYKMFNFTLTVSPHYLVKLETTQKQPTASCSGFYQTGCA